MKKKLMLFNRKHKKNKAMRDDVIDLDEDFDEEAYTDEDYADEDYEDYDDEDYPDEEFEEDYGGDYQSEGDEHIEKDDLSEEAYREDADYRRDDADRDYADTDDDYADADQGEYADDRYAEDESADTEDTNVEGDDIYEKNGVEEGEYYEADRNADDYYENEGTEADKYYEDNGAEEDEYYESERTDDEYYESDERDERDEYYESDEDYMDEDGYDYDDEEVAEYEDERGGYYDGGRDGRGGGHRDSGRGGRGGRDSGHGGSGRGGRGKRRRSAANPAAAIGAKILDFVRESSVAERAAAIVAVLLLAAGITTMVFYSRAKDYSEEIGSFAEVGANFNVDGTIGSYGLLAIADAEKAKAYAASMVEEIEEEEEEVSDVAEGVTIQMTLTTIKSDMKIKFINSETNKLVANVHFEVEVVTPDGTMVSYDDHDKDGIIYKNNLTAGTYKVTPKPLAAEYSDYKVETETKSLKIKDTVEMKAVDVSNEIKKESQVNAAVEDTAVADVIESALQDTVEYVESTKTPIEGDGGDGEYSYESIDKKDITDPSTSSKLTAGSVKRMSAVRAKTAEENTGDESELKSEDNSEENQEEEKSEDEKSEDEKSEDDSSSEGESTEPEKPKEIKVTPSSMSLKVGEGESFIVSGPEDYSVSNSNSSVIELDDHMVTAVGPGSATITISADGYESASISVTVEGGKEEEDDTPKGDITLSTDSLTMEVGETGKLTASGADGIKFKSNDESVAKVSKDGTVTAIAAGSCVITAYADGYTEAKCDITVKSKSKGSELEMSATKVTVVQGQSVKISPKDKSLSVSYSSSNTDIATVSDGTITGVKSGEATITASCDGYKDAKISVKVVKGTGTLKTKDGKAVYVKNSDGKYVEATYDDYYKGSKFYIRKAATAYKYTGWQTLDGKTYYFDKNGNYVTGEQVIQGAKYSFSSEGVLSSSSGTMGIDVSKWNGNINWSQVKNSGVNFVIIRCGYRGSSAGALIEDPKFKANIQGASAAGLRVGVYFFSQAVNEVEAVEEASMCINLCKGYGLSFPIFIDVEGSNGRGDAVSTSQRTANIKAFCGTIQSAGYRAGVYANKTWFSQRINTSQLTNYKIWLAQYAASVSYTATRYDMWQYTSKGSVPGISGNVDMNILYN